MIWEIIFSVLFWLFLASYDDMDRLRRLGRGPWILPRTPPQVFERQPEVVISSSSSFSSLNCQQSDESNTFYPSVDDVLRVRNLLQWLGPPNTGLPAEVVDMIVDEAEYWPSVETSIQNTPIAIRQDGDRECLRTPPLCYDVGGQSPSRVLSHRGIHPCRKIVFAISAHDQGWGGEQGCKGTYRGSYTWFDAYIVPSGRSSNDGQQKQPNYSEQSAQNTENATRSQEQTDQSFQPERPFLPTSSKLQSNRTATRTTQDHHIVWHYRDRIDPDSDEAARIELEHGRGRATLDGRAVREMQVGDAVSVWARARFGGWSNHIEKMSVRVFWAV
ncbi:hypothetical protein VTN77DRAFT_3411 [Rasamsonia byssochlamydoides]|uniref:uncharacterized protein n=1 Tax=Rasamsonia byssochlamydoides TaxID=89139 RepID=UPI00374478E0